MSLYMYKEKYTKYKNKYLELKKQLGGSYYGPPGQPPARLTNAEIIRHLLYERWSNWLWNNFYSVQGRNPIIITFGQYHLTMYSDEINNMRGHITTNNHPRLHYHLECIQIPSPIPNPNDNNLSIRSIWVDTDDPSGSYPYEVDDVHHLRNLFEDIWTTIIRTGHITNFNQIN